MLSGAAGLLIVFYLGAVCLTGRAWLQVLRGRAGAGAIRDLTGITGTGEMVRRFGLADGRGRFPVRPGDIARHRTRAGAVIGDLPTQLLLLAALATAWAQPGAATAAAAVVAAGMHAALTVIVALRLAAADPRSLAE